MSDTPIESEELTDQWAVDKIREVTANIKKYEHTELKQFYICQQHALLDYILTKDVNELIRNALVI